MKQYLDLLERILRTGTKKAQRAHLKDGSIPDTYSIFGDQIRYDLQKGFPICTTKKIPFKLICHELLWFLSGSTNIKYLVDNDIHIWDAWADKNGELGPVYGKQWRLWQNHKTQRIDQISNLIRDIKKVRDNPHASEARRLILTSWNPGDMPDPKVPTGCHTLAQWNLTNNKLSCHLYQRSGDAFLGVPFNISSYCLLTHILANLCNVDVGDYIHSFGDVHIYENHKSQVEEQLTRTPKVLPTLSVGIIKAVDCIDINQIRLLNYECYPSLKGEIAI